MFGVRPAQRTDYPAICRLPKNEDELFYMYPSGTFPLTPNQIEEVVKTRLYPTVLVDGDRVIGFANFYGFEKTFCWLGNVIVDPGYRGKGAASTLIGAMMDIAKRKLHVTRLQLVCHHTNLPAILFYAKVGFKPFGISEKKYIDPRGQRLAGIQMGIDL